MNYQYIIYKFFEDRRVKKAKRKLEKEKLLDINKCPICLKDIIRTPEFLFTSPLSSLFNDEHGICKEHGIVGKFNYWDGCI